MIVQCAQCSSRYQLDADRVPRQQIRVRCPSCAGVFMIDGREAEELVGAGVSQEASRAVAPAAPESAPSAPAPASYGDITLDQPAASPEPAPEPTPAPTPEPAAETAEPSGPSSSLDFEIERASEPPIARPEAAFAAPSASPVESDAPGRSAAATVDQEDEKCRRLARALVSDILVYNRDLRDKSLAEGNLVQALGVEIKKSWELYKEKVTPEVANGNNYFREALNEILADGQKIF